MRAKSSSPIVGEDLDRLRSFIELRGIDVGYRYDVEIFGQISRAKRRRRQRREPGEAREILREQGRAKRLPGVVLRIERGLRTSDKELMILCTLAALQQKLATAERCERDAAEHRRGCELRKILGGIGGVLLRFENSREIATTLPESTSCIYAVIVTPTRARRTSQPRPTYRAEPISVVRSLLDPRDQKLRHGARAVADLIVRSRSPLLRRRPQIRWRRCRHC